MMMKRNMKLLMLASLLGFVALSAQAVPAKKGVWRMVTLADGTQKRVELRGDEFCSYWVDAEGVSYNLDSESKRYVRVDANALQLRASQLRAKANQDRIERMVKARHMTVKKSLGQTNGSYFGKKKGLIILVQYKDKKFKFGHNQKMYNRIANETGYANSLGFVGSVKDYSWHRVMDSLNWTLMWWDLIHSIMNMLTMAHLLETHMMSVLVTWCMMLVVWQTLTSTLLTMIGMAMAMWSKCMFFSQDSDRLQVVTKILFGLMNTNCKKETTVRM